jgi:hypothetical protein
VKARVFISSTSELQGIGQELAVHIRDGSPAHKALGVEFAPWYYDLEQPVAVDPRPETVVPAEIGRSMIFIGLLGASDGSLVRLALPARLGRLRMQSRIPWVQFESELAAKNRLLKAYFLHRPAEGAAAEPRAWWARFWVKPFSHKSDLFKLVDTFLIGCLQRWIALGVNTPRVERLLRAGLVMLSSFALLVVGCWIGGRLNDRQALVFLVVAITVTAVYWFLVSRHPRSQE